MCFHLDEQVAYYLLSEVLHLIVFGDDIRVLLGGVERNLLAVVFAQNNSFEKRHDFFHRKIARQLRQLMQQVNVFVEDKLNRRL